MLFKKNPTLGCAIGLFMFGAQARAGITVVVNGSACDPCVNYNSGLGEYEVAIDVSMLGANTTATVTGTGSETIRFIDVTTQSNSSYKIGLTVSAASNVKSVSKSAGNGELWITSITTGSIGNVTANIIDSVQAQTGDVYGDITQVDDGGVLATTEAGISLVESIGGNITGDISADRLIDFISAFYGTIGTNASTRSTIQCDTKIDDILAGAIYADITVGSSGNADLNSLVTDAGDFAGSLACARITGYGYDYALNIKGGDLKADIDHDSAVMFNHFRIGGTLDSGAEILLPTSGLTKQIIINADNTGDDWDGNVKLNGTAISHDANGVYTNTPVSLGYGSVGQARFRFHPEGSNPADGATVYDSYYDPEWVGEGDPPCGHNFKHAYIRHFGPLGIDYPAGVADMYLIERRPAGGGSWTDVTSSFNAPSISTINGGVGRSTHITRTSTAVWDADYEYRFTLNERQFTTDTALVSLDVTGQPRVPTYVYSFTLLDGCAEFLDSFFDQNGDDMLTESDLSAWPGINPDLSLNNSVGSEDFALLVRGLIQRSALD